MTEIFALFPVIGSVAIICFLACQFLKLIPAIKNNSGIVTVVSGLLGGIVAVVGTVLGIPPLVGYSIYDSIASGIVSGLAASGLYDIKNAIKTIVGIVNKTGSATK